MTHVACIFCFLHATMAYHTVQYLSSTSARVVLQGGAELREGSRGGSDGQGSYNNRNKYFEFRKLVGHQRP